MKKIPDNPKLLKPRPWTKIQAGVTGARDARWRDYVEPIPPKVAFVKIK